MALSVRDKADTIATYRYLSVHCMETLARWVPVSPELDAKVVMGRHIWDFAQHADELGKRTAELRSPLHHDREPRASYLTVLDAIRNAPATPERLAGMYRVLLPDTIRRVEEQIAAADPILDEPSLRIMERMRFDYERMLRQFEELLEERPDLALDRTDWVSDLQRSLEDIADFVDYRTETVKEEWKV